MTKEEAQEYLKRKALYSIDVPGFGIVEMNETEFADFTQNPLKFVAQTICCRQEELLAFLNTNCNWSYPQCRAITKKGERCKNLTTDVYLCGFHDWLRLHRDQEKLLCSTHKRMKGKVQQIPDE